MIDYNTKNIYMKDYKEVVKSWLEGNFDAETKAEVLKLQETDPAGLKTHSTATSSSGPAASAASWAWVPTG